MAKKMTGFEKQRILKTHSRRRGKPHGRRHAKKMSPKSNIFNKRGFYL